MMKMEKSLDQRITTRLSLAVSLKDDYTLKEEILGKAKVSMPSLKLEAVKNPSGYYIFCDLPDDTYSMQIESDYYMDKEVDDIVIPFEDDPPLFKVTLNPGSLYPFPIWATLLRGVVSDEDGNDIFGALVECEDKDLSTTTSAKGEFVLYFPVEQEDETIEIKVTPDGGPTTIIPDVEVKKCKTTTMSVTI